MEEEINKIINKLERKQSMLLLLMFIFFIIFIIIEIRNNGEIKKIREDMNEKLEKIKDIMKIQEKTDEIVIENIFNREDDEINRKSNLTVNLGGFMFRHNIDINYSNNEICWIQTIQGDRYFNQSNENICNQIVILK